MKRILIVDDAKDVRQSIMAMLKNQPYELLEAGNGEEAWDLILKSHPDLVVLDIKMPIMDGLDLLREMKNEWIDIPVMIITGDASITLQESAKILGAKHFFTKPLEPNIFVQTINNLSQVA